MNDLEIIEHWALRDALMRWFVEGVIAFVVGILATIAGFVFETWLFAFSAVAAALLATLCLWRVHRISVRLVELEDRKP